MKKIYLLLLSLVLAYSLLAQSSGFLDEGRKYQTLDVQTHKNSSGVIFGHFTKYNNYRIGDTVSFRDTLYRTIYKNDTVLKWLVREDTASGKVLLRVDTNKAEFLLYDFRMKASDIYFVSSDKGPFVESDNVCYRIEFEEEFDSVVVEGIKRRVFLVKYYLGFECEFEYPMFIYGIIIEGIGDLDGPFNFGRNSRTTYWDHNENKHRRYLLCVKDQDENLLNIEYPSSATYPRPNNPGCDSSLNITQLLAENEINIYPNPAASHICIKGKNEHQLTFRISNYLGQVQQSGTLPLNEDCITIDNLAKGIYYLELLDDTTSGRTVKKFLVQ